VGANGWFYLLVLIIWIITDCQASEVTNPTPAPPRQNVLGEGFGKRNNGDP